MHKRLLILVLLTPFLLDLYGQWQVTTARSSNEVVCDLMDIFEPSQYTNGYHFWGIPQSPIDSVRQKGVVLNVQRTEWTDFPIQDTATLNLLLDKSIEPNAFVNLGMARLYIDAYVKNIESYCVLLERVQFKMSL